MIVTRTSASFGIALLVTSEPMRAIRSLFQLGRVRARACARYGVLVVGEEMKGLVNCNFLPGSARRLELGTVSPEPLSRAYWSQKLRPLGETVGLSRARTSGESPDSTQAGPVAHPARGNQRPSPLGYLLKADAKRYVIAAVEALAEHKPFADAARFVSGKKGRCHRQSPTRRSHFVNPYRLPRGGGTKPA